MNMPHAAHPGHSAPGSIDITPLRPDLEALGAFIAEGGRMADVVGVDDATCEALYAVAHHALLQGQHQEALLLFSRLCTLDAMSPSYRWGLALTCREMGHIADALAHLVICCQLEPDRPDGLIEMARCLLSAGDEETAKECLAVALTLCTAPSHAAERARAQAQGLLALLGQPSLSPMTQSQGETP